MYANHLQSNAQQTAITAKQTATDAKLTTMDAINNVMYAMEIEMLLMVAKHVAMIETLPSLKRKKESQYGKVLNELYKALNAKLKHEIHG